MQNGHPVTKTSPEPSRLLLLSILGVGVLAVSSGAILVRLADAHPLVVSAYRVGFAFLILLPWSARATVREWQGWDRAARIRCVAAGLFLAVHVLVWITSLSYTSVANSVLLVNTAPIWVGLLSPLVTRDRTSRRLWTAIGMCGLGCLVIGWDGLRFGGETWLGDALAVAGGLGAALYLMMGRSVRDRVSILSYLTVCYGTAAVALWLLVFAGDFALTGFTPRTWWALLGLAVISQHLGHSAYNWCLKHLTVGLLAVTLMGEPVLSSLWALLLFQESLSAPQLAGGVFVLAGILVAALPANRL